MKYWYSVDTININGKVVVNEFGIIVHTEPQLRIMLGERITDHPEWDLEKEEQFKEF